MARSRSSSPASSRSCSPSPVLRVNSKRKAACEKKKGHKMTKAYMALSPKGKAYKIGGRCIKTTKATKTKKCAKKAPTAWTKFVVALYDAKGKKKGLTYGQTMTKAKKVYAPYKGKTAPSAAKIAEMVKKTKL